MSQHGHSVTRKTMKTAHGQCTVAAISDQFSGRTKVSPAPGHWIAISSTCGV